MYLINLHVYGHKTKNDSRFVVTFIYFTLQVIVKRVTVWNKRYPQVSQEFPSDKSELSYIERLVCFFLIN